MLAMSRATAVSDRGNGVKILLIRTPQVPHRVILRDDEIPEISRTTSAVLTEARRSEGHNVRDAIVSRSGGLLATVHPADQTDVVEERQQRGREPGHVGPGGGIEHRRHARAFLAALQTAIGQTEV